MKITLTDSRRLTGPNLYWQLPSAVIDVAADAGDAKKLLACWEKYSRRLMDALGWTGEHTCYRVFEGGISLLLSAPIDVLYTAIELNEAAFNASRAELSGAAPVDLDAEMHRLQTLQAGEQNPALLALQAAAIGHGKRFLWDDDLVSAGYGATAVVWPVGELPAPEAVDWASIGSVPLALVTGTNGKSTSVRLAAWVMAAAGRNAGITSTDFIRVGSNTIDTGDFSGPGGARTLVRDPRTEVAILEIARGGMLRRGLGVYQADAALITNVSADHLGEYGINSVPELIEAKFIVQKALQPGQPLVLNADDPGIVAHARGLEQRIVWFSEHPDNPVIRDHLGSGAEAVVCHSGSIVWCRGTEQVAVAQVRDIPITMNGHAHHNVQNALGVTALCMVLGVAPADIATGLGAFESSPAENPGRGNYFSAGGVGVLVDFAHNEAGVTAMIETILAMPASRRLVMMGQAGDRSDALIRGLVEAAMRARPDCLIACNLPGYERGREPGEVAALIARYARESGLPESAICFAENTPDGTQKALSWAQPGDLLLLLALNRRDEVFAVLKKHGF